jgi:hypothetical protein
MLNEDSVVGDIAPEKGIVLVPEVGLVRDLSVKTVLKLETPPSLTVPLTILNAASSIVVNFVQPTGAVG